MRPSTLRSTASLLMILVTTQTLVNSFSPNVGVARRVKNTGPWPVVSRAREPALYDSLSSSAWFRQGDAGHGPALQLRTSSRSPTFSRLAAAVSLTWSTTRKLVRRSLLSVALVAMLWGGLALQTTAPSHASTTTTAQAASTTSPIELVLQRTSPSLDRMVDRYVKSYMFADDSYDPVESIYREAYEDATVGQHPSALAEIKRQVLGDSKKVVAPTSEGFASWLTSTTKKLQQRGMSESAAILVLASVFVIAGPSLFLFTGMIIGGISKRNIRRLMKKRYGDTYTVDATIKKEEVIEAPEDEDDGDEDDDDSDENDEDDDEE